MTGDQVKELRQQIIEIHDENRRQLAKVSEEAEKTEHDLRRSLEEAERKHKSQLEQQR